MIKGPKEASSNNVLIYDTGGGTFWRFPLEVKPTAGDSHLEGRGLQQPDRGCPQAGFEMKEKRQGSG